MEGEKGEHANANKTWLSTNWTSGTVDSKIGVEMLHIRVILDHLIRLLLGSYQVLTPQTRLYVPCYDWFTENIYLHRILIK